MRRSDSIKHFIKKADDQVKDGAIMDGGAMAQMRTSKHPDGSRQISLHEMRTMQRKREECQVTAKARDG